MAGFGYGGGGQNLTANSRFAQLLAQSDPNNGSVAGGIGSMAQKLLMGLMLGKDQQDETQANEAFTQGMSAKPWVNPDTGTTTMPGALPPDHMQDAMQAMNLNPQEQYLYQQHLKNLGTKPVYNGDGSTSTLRQAGMQGPDGKQYNIPTVWDGKVLDPREAMHRAQAAGLQNFPSYGSPDEAEARYQQMHGFMEKDVPQNVPTGPAGGLAGGLAAMQGLQGNPYAGRMAQQLMMKKAESDQTTQAMMQKLMLENQLGTARDKAKSDYEPRVVGPGAGLYRGSEQIASTPAAPKAPRTVTTDKGVFLQNDDGSLGARLGGNPSQANNGPAGPYGGNSMEAQDQNILLRGDPTTPDYKAAYIRQASPKITFDPVSQQTVTVRPDMSAYAMPGQPRGQGAPHPAPAAPAPPPAAPQGAPQGSAPGPQGGLSVQPLPNAGPSAASKKDMNTALEGASTIVNALDGFSKSFSTAGTGERVRSAAGANTPLNTSYNIAALMAKGEDLFKLGVLSGPDLDIIRRTLPDPSTISGGLTETADMQASLNQVINLIQSRISAKTRQNGMPDVDIRAYSKSLTTGPQGQRDPATMSDDEIKQALGLK